MKNANQIFVRCFIRLIFFCLIESKNNFFQIIAMFNKITSPHCFVNELPHIKLRKSRKEIIFASNKLLYYGLIYVDIIVNDRNYEKCRFKNKKRIDSTSKEPK